jgi:hypothetical protein
MNMPAFTQRGTHKEKRVAAFLLQPVDMLAEWTGLEPATPGVTGRYSNQLNYHSMHRHFMPTPTATAVCQLPLATPRGFEPLLQP